MLLKYLYAKMSIEKKCQCAEMYLTELVGAQSPMSVVLTDQKRTAQILRVKTLRLL